MDKSIKGGTALTAELFDYTRINARAAYVQLYGKLPNCVQMYRINTEKAYKFIQSEYKDLIVQDIHNAEIYADKPKLEKTETLLIMKNEVLIELGETYCEVYYSGEECSLVEKLKEQLPKYKRTKRRPLEINLITQSRRGLDLESMEVKRTKLDLDLYYDDNFIEVDKQIRHRLNRRKDKGIVLLHGEPGTGKTTYLRYLIGKLKKKVMFIPPDIAGQIGNPELVQLLIANPDSVLIIEDAENIIMQRSAGQWSSVSNLLNISDGLLSDCLNVQVICTFNCAVSKIDNALMRKGRLIARYEFDKLSVPKAQKLSDKAGFDTIITEPMSVAEVMNQNQKPQKQVDITQPIGFRAQWQAQA